MTKKLTVGVRLHIKLEDIENLLYSCATGSNYWCEDSFKLGFEKTVKVILNPKGGMIALHDAEEDGKYHELNLKKIKKGLAIMAKKEPAHFGDLIADNADQITADVFLQCCLFGEVIYG